MIWILYLQDKQTKVITMPPIIFATAEHGGTHIDAPIHFSETGQTVDEIPLENLIGNAIKIDVSSKAMNDPDYLITVEDLTRWEDMGEYSNP